MFFKRQKTAPPTPAQTWVLAAITPMLEVADFSATQLFEPVGRPDQRQFAEMIGWVDAETVLEGVVQTMYAGERVQVARLQHANPSFPQVDAVVYDLVFALVGIRAAINAQGIDAEDGEGLLYAVARRLQAQFASWQAFGAAFVQAYGLQRQLTDQSTQETKADIVKLTSSMNRLGVGLWQAVPWDLPLPMTNEGERHLERATRAFLSSALFYRDRARFTPSSEHWCLAVAAVYRAWWGEPIDSLEGAEVITTILGRDWGVNDRDDLLGVLRSLLLEGHRPELTRMQRSDPQLSQVNPLAWDLVRFMQIATSGVCASFLTRDEARALMLHAAHPLQSAYGSWAEMLDAFQVGRDLWQRLVGIDLQEAAEGNADLDDLLETLKVDPYSPCVRVPWNQPLEPIDGGGAFAEFGKPRTPWKATGRVEENPYKK
jgi:hypothetical protein